MNLAIFWSLVRGLHWPLIPANRPAILAGAVVNYTVSRHWVWGEGRSEWKKGDGEWRVERGAAGRGLSSVARFPLRPSRPLRGTFSRRAFTLVELLVVIAILGILASLPLPALGMAKAKAVSGKCLNNLKQLQLGWQMYVDDHGGAVPPNRSTYDGQLWRSTPDSWVGHSSAPHDTEVTNIHAGLLFQYDCNRSLALYRCPGDKSLTVGPRKAPRTRSYSMNGNLGGRTNEVQQTITRESEIGRPAGLFVFVDEHEDSIDGAHFPGLARAGRPLGEPARRAARQHGRAQLRRRPRRALALARVQELSGQAKSLEARGERGRLRRPPPAAAEPGQRVSRPRPGHFRGGNPGLPGMRQGRQAGRRSRL